MNRQCGIKDLATLSMVRSSIMMRSLVAFDGDDHVADADMMADLRIIDWITERPWLESMPRS